MQRIVKPEILDELAEDHPDAIKNRKDLRLLNFLMGSHRWIANQGNKYFRENDKILEIGAGNGDLGRYLLKSLKAHKHLKIDGLDICSRPKDWPGNWGWHQTDLKTFTGYNQYSVILANLIFHQFKDKELLQIGNVINKNTRLIITNELVRKKIHIYQLYLTRLLGINYVTLHDGAVSVEAGFAGKELSEFLGLDDSKWENQSASTILGSYRLVAKIK